MIGFGERNEELGEHYTFLVGLTDNLDHELRLYVAAAIEGEPEQFIDYGAYPESVRGNIEGSPELQDMLLSSYPVFASEEDIYEIAFDGYVLFMERDESYTVGDDYEECEGRYLVRLTKSRLMDDLDHYSPFVGTDWPGLLTHYGVYCEDHLVDVVTSVEPRIRKLGAEEISARGFGFIVGDERE